VKEHCSTRTVIGFDPSYIPKSGKKTEGVGKFWSGCAGAPKWGLEISGIAAIDLDNHTAMHLEAIQTLPNESETLPEFYAKSLIDRKEELQKISNIIIVDAYFSKKTFVTPVCKAGFHIVSKLRNDARMTYIIEPIKTGGRGRPKTVGDKVDVKNLDLKYFQKIKTDKTDKTDNSDNPEELVYTAIVRAVALKRDVRVVIVKSKQRKSGVAIFFSTDTNMSAQEILEIYRTRFQIEFLYRDAKQHTGLTDCQARSKEKLHFHFNMSLTSVSVAKAVHWFSIPKEKRKSFSMANIKTMNHNALLLERFLCVFAVKPNILKNNQNIKELLLYGTIAA
jgi:hypothetical protein